MDNKEIKFNVNGITYKIDYWHNNIPSNRVIIDDINLEGNIYIPSIIPYNKEVYYVCGFTSDFYINILNKNITYFIVDKSAHLMLSIDGIIYFKYIFDKTEYLAIIVVPPKLNIDKLKLPKNHINTIPLNNICTNKKLKTLIIDGYHDHAYDVYNTTIENIIYKNKKLIKSNYKWKIKY